MEKYKEISLDGHIQILEFFFFFYFNFYGLGVGGGGWGAGIGLVVPGSDIRTHPPNIYVYTI